MLRWIFIGLLVGILFGLVGYSGRAGCCQEQSVLSEATSAIPSATPMAAPSTPLPPKEKKKGFMEEQSQDMLIVFVLFVGVFITGYLLVRRQPNQLHRQRIEKKRKKRFKA